MDSAQGLEPKMRVKVAGELDPGATRGMFGVGRQVSERRPGAEGELLQMAGGTGGEVWFVRHDDGTVGIYAFTEFDLAD